MLFKLISDGQHTVVELDGKRLGNSMTGVSFSHQREGNEIQVLAHIDLDLTRTFEKDFVRDAEPDDFTIVNENFEQCERIRRQRKIAANETERRMFREAETAEACEASARITPNAKEMIDKINQRVQKLSAIATCDSPEASDG